MAALKSKFSEAGRRTPILAAATIGFALWVTSPALVGQTEPWDAEWPYYPIVMLAAGALLGLAWPRHWIQAFLALWAGQCIALLLPPHELAWFLLGVATTGIGSLLGLVGAIIGAAIHRVCQKLARKSDSGSRPNRQEDPVKHPAPLRQDDTRR